MFIAPAFLIDTRSGGAKSRGSKISRSSGARGALKAARAINMLLLTEQGTSVDYTDAH